LQKEDLQMPRLLLAQAMSPQVEESDPLHIEDLKVGQFFNSMTGEIYGKGPLEFVVIRADKPRHIEFIPRNEGGGIKDYNVPANDPRTQFTTDEDGKRIKPVATKFYDFVILLLPTLEPVALSLKSTQLKVARQLNTLMKLRKAPVFAGKYMLVSVPQKFAKGTVPVHQIKNSNIPSDMSATDKDGNPLPGWVSEGLFKFASDQYDSFKDKDLVIDREPTTDEEDGDGGDAGDATEQGAEASDTSFDTSKM
jgi:hypothetical protein